MPSIEAGGISAAVSVAPAISVGSTISTGGSLGLGVEAIGPVMGSATMASIVNEGPVGFAGLENTMVLAKGFNPIGEIKFNNVPSVAMEPTASDRGGVSMLPDIDAVTAVIEAERIVSPLKEAEVLAEANNILGIVKPVKVEPPTKEPRIEEAVYWFTDVPKAQQVIKPAEVIMPQNEPVIGPLPTPKVWEYAKPLANTESDPVVQVSSKPVVESAAYVQTVPATLTEPMLAEQEVEEEVVEQTVPQSEGISSSEIEDTELSKVKIVESVQTSQKRRSEIIAAVKRAVELGITVKEALTDGFWRLKSPLVKEGKDWTVDLTAEELNINPAKFNTVEQAEEVSVGVVASNMPVEEGEEGKQATVGQVRKVTHGEDDKLKPKTPAEIVYRRRVKKQMIVNQTRQGLPVIEKRAETPLENTLQDLNLAEVFPKAA